MYLEIWWLVWLCQFAGWQPRVYFHQAWVGIYIRNALTKIFKCGFIMLQCGASPSPRNKRKRHHDQPGSWPHIDLGFGGASMVQARLRRTRDSWWLWGAGSWPHHLPIISFSLLFFFNGTNTKLFDFFHFLIHIFCSWLARPFCALANW